MVTHICDPGAGDWGHRKEEGESQDPVDQSKLRSIETPYLKEHDRAGYLIHFSGIWEYILTSVHT